MLPMGPQCPTANENENLISRHIVAGRIVTSAVKCAAEKIKNKDPSQKKGGRTRVGPSFVKQALQISFSHVLMRMRFSIASSLDISAEEQLRMRDSH